MMAIFILTLFLVELKYHRRFVHIVQSEFHFCRLQFLFILYIPLSLFACVINGYIIFIFLSCNNRFKGFFSDCMHLFQLW
jgi:hypothetical protein